MAAMEMYDYVGDRVADYTATELTVTPQKVLTESGDKGQVVHQFDDLSVSVVSLSDSSSFTVTLQWDLITPEEAGTIVDLWHDASKANGRERTFYWPHPRDGHTYVVRFLEPLQRAYRHNFAAHQQITQIKLKVEGRKAE